MKHLRYDQPVTGDALLLGARLPRREEVLTPPPAPVETSPGVFIAHDGKFFTVLEEPKSLHSEGIVSVKAPDDFKADFENYVKDFIKQARAFQKEGTVTVRLPATQWPPTTPKGMRALPGHIYESEDIRSGRVSLPEGLQFREMQSGKFLCVVRPKGKC